MKRYGHALRLCSAVTRVEQETLRESESPNLARVSPAWLVQLHTDRLLLSPGLLLRARRSCKVVDTVGETLAGSYAPQQVL